MEQVLVCDDGNSQTVDTVRHSAAALRNVAGE
jgi:hypothetical protein